jgi:mannitol-specific phosphotransferase system IIBC component
MTLLIRLLLMVVGGYYVYKNRYKVVSAMMSVQSIRQAVVPVMMKIPGVREKFIHQAFRA